MTDRQARETHLPPRQVSLIRGLIAVLAILALLALLFPSGLANWIDEKCFGNAICDGLGQGLRTIEDGWRAIGFADARDNLSEWLRTTLGIPE